MTPALLADLVRAAASDVLARRGLDAAALPEDVTVERPRNPEHGDYATNVALRTAKKAGVAPRDLATWLADELAEKDGIASAEIAGPGFINLRLAADAQGGIVADVLAGGASYGNGDEYAGCNVNLEFVSANPTGPLHLGGTRWAAVGDALGRVLSARGAKVTREYYFNDAGGQIDRFVRSLVAAASGAPAPEDGYGGAYIGEIAARVVAAEPDALSSPDRDEIFRRVGVGLMFDEIKADLHVVRHRLRRVVPRAVAARVRRGRRGRQRLKASGSLYFADGAWWLRSSDYGDDKDRPVIKSDGKPAYIAGDVAYYLDKRERGFDLCIYMLGADHHGYIGRLKAVAAALRRRPGAWSRCSSGRWSTSSRTARRCGCASARAPSSRWRTWSRRSASTRRGTR